MQFLTLILFAYLLGSIPFGFMIAKAHGKDLRLIGSGNIGATNATRALGKKWGYLCLLLDVLKGLIPMLLVPMLNLVDSQTASPGRLALWLLVGCAAVLGHVFPIYLKFKGGKGVATSLGIVLGLWPYYTLCGIGVFAIWGVTLLIWRTVSLSSILAAISFPVLLLLAILVHDEPWDFVQLWPLLFMSVLMALLVVARHTENIKRLLNGSESKIMQTKNSTNA
ncbi:MAG: glycerol-3-phosphate 1-O-acyltransferase PlsY [Planctomycetes bacterium]|nr:glycerol-3-phosphate 1-O-acyltransferase PlsY [Planctomycetota bacterium]